MDLPYHEQITRAAVGTLFDTPAMAQILAANFEQDALRNLVGKPYLHFDDNKIAESLAYVDTCFERIATVMAHADVDVGAEQRRIFGQLSHTVQDFYAHSNYVNLWFAEYGTEQSTPKDIDSLDAALLHHAALRTGSFRLWRDIVYYIPGVKYIARKLYIPPHSHEAMHLDNPQRGVKFEYAMAAAIRRTRHEYHRVIKIITAYGGDIAVQRFLRAV